MSVQPLANWNGAIMPLDEVRVSVLDRSFLFGDAVYEALRVYSGRAWLCPEHMGRLRRSLSELRIHCDVDRLEQRLHETLRQSGTQDGLVYVHVTRGVAPRAHHFPDPPVSPNELIYVRAYDEDPYAAHRETGASVITHPDERWSRRDIKSVNLLGNVLASQAAAEAGCVEALLVTPTGEITEGTHSNVFGVKGGKLLTSPRGHHILPGTTRGFVLRLAERAGVAVTEQSLRADGIHDLDELFLTGTTTEVLAVTTVDGRPLGNGKPGPITRRMSETYKHAVADWLSE